MDFYHFPPLLDQRQIETGKKYSKDLRIGKELKQVTAFPKLNKNSTNTHIYIGKVHIPGTVQLLPTTTASSKGQMLRFSLLQKY